MKRTSVLGIALAGALLSVIALLAWLCSVPRSSSSGPDARTEVGASPGAKLSAVAAAQAEQERLAGATERVDASADPRAATELESTLSGVVLGTRDTLVAGAEVSLVVRPAGRQPMLFDTGYVSEARELASRRTDARGRFVFEVEPARAYELRVRADGYAPARIGELGAGPPIEIRLVRGASLTVRVVRKSDAVPVADARVVIHRNTGPNPEDARTDERGEAHFTGLPAGPAYAQAIPGDEADAGADVELADGEARTIDVVVGEGHLVRGTITARGSGRPIADAEVSAWEFYAKTVRADAFGRYAIEGVNPRGVDFTTVSARAPGFGRVDRRLPLTSGTAAVCDIELAPGLSVRGRLLDAGGRPVELAYVAAVGASFDPPGRDLVAGRSVGDGRFELHDLARSMPHALFVRATGRGTMTLDLPRPPDEAPAIDLGELVLPDGAGLAGRVLSSDRSPVAGAEIRILDRSASPQAAAVALDFEQATTDAHGAFRVCDLSPGRHELSVQSNRGEARLEFELGAGEVRREVEIVLPGGSVLAGRVLDPDGASVRGALVFAHGAGFTTSGEDGSFHFEGVRAMSLRVEARPYGPIERGGETVWLLGTETTAVPPGTTDLVLTLRPADVIEGRLLALDGKPLVGGWVEALDPQGAQVAEAPAREGEFRLIVPAKAVVDLSGFRRVLHPDARFERVDVPGQHARAQGVRAGTRGLVLRFVAE